MTKLADVFKRGDEVIAVNHDLSYIYGTVQEEPYDDNISVIILSLGPDDGEIRRYYKEAVFHKGHDYFIMEYVQKRLQEITENAVLTIYESTLPPRD